MYIIKPRLYTYVPIEKTRWLYRGQSTFGKYFWVILQLITRAFISYTTMEEEGVPFGHGPTARKPLIFKLTPVVKAYIALYNKIIIIFFFKIRFWPTRKPTTGPKKSLNIFFESSLTPIVWYQFIYDIPKLFLSSSESVYFVLKTTLS